MSVLFTFCAAFLSWLFPSTYRTQHALQWWHQQQINRLHNGAELIRDGILQELFAIRRGLELTHDEQVSVSHDQIHQIEALHHQLEALSNQLSPAFVRDSLPLAFQHVVQQWARQHSEHTVLTQLPKTLYPMSARGRIALTALEELLLIFSDHLSDPLQKKASVNVELKNTDGSVVLTVGIDCGAAPGQCRAIAQLREVAYLRQSFEFLTQGRTHQRVYPTSIEWRFIWEPEL